MTNHGNSYNNITGAFRARVPGTYKFTLFFHTANCDTKLAIVKDCSDETLCFADSENRDMVSCSTIVDLDLGDVIKVKVRKSVRRRVCVDGVDDGNSLGITGFVGYLLHKI